MTRVKDARCVGRINVVPWVKGGRECLVVRTTGWRVRVLLGPIVSAVEVGPCSLTAKQRDRFDEIMAIVFQPLDLARGATCEKKCETEIVNLKRTFGPL